MLLLALLSALAPSAEAQRFPPLDRLPFRFVVKLEIAGAPLIIDQVLSCDMRVRVHPGTGTSFRDLRERPEWFVNRRTVHAELNDGSVVIVYTPSVCDTLEKRLRPLPDDFFPVIAWVSGARDFEVAEFYVSRRYFRRDDARVKFVASSVEAVTSTSQIDQSNDFEDFRLGGIPVPNGKSYAFFLGVSVTAFPFDVWRESTPLSQLLPKLTAFGEVLGRDALFATSRLRKRETNLLTESEGLGLPSGDAFESSYIAATRLIGDRLQLDSGEFGLLRLYRQPGVKVISGKFPLSAILQKPTTVMLGAKAVTLGSAQLVFDPETMTLYHLRKNYLIW